MLDSNFSPNYTAMIAISIAIVLWVLAGYYLSKPSNTNYR